MLWRLGGVGLGIVPPFRPLVLLMLIVPFPLSRHPNHQTTKTTAGEIRRQKKSWHFHVLEFNEAIISSKPIRHLEASRSKPYTGQLVDACPDHHPIVGIPVLLSRPSVLSLHRKQRDAPQTPLARPSFTETDRTSAQKRENGSLCKLSVSHLHSGPYGNINRECLAWITGDPWPEEHKAHAKKKPWTIRRRRGVAPLEATPVWPDRRRGRR